jgi:hypothetical protein
MITILSAADAKRPVARQLAQNSATFPQTAMPERTMPLTTEQRRRNEASIRAAMDRLLLGQLPPRGACDLKTLAREAGVARTGFYARTDPQGNLRPGPYQHLAEEFQRRLADFRKAGTISDPRELRIARLKDENAKLRERDAQITAHRVQGTRVVTAHRAARRDPPASAARRLAEQRPQPPCQEVEDHRTMRLNEELFQSNTATRQHTLVLRNSHHLMWTDTVPMGSIGWSQHDTPATGHGHCRDNCRQHTGNVEQIMRAHAGTRS